MGSPSAAPVTRSGDDPLRTSLIRPLRPGVLCRTITIAAGRSEGNDRRILLIACIPPAEAAIVISHGTLTAVGCGGAPWSAVMASRCAQRRCRAAQGELPACFAKIPDELGVPFERA